jgi:hypothetical protein
MPAVQAMAVLRTATRRASRRAPRSQGSGRVSDAVSRYIFALQTDIAGTHDLKTIFAYSRVAQSDLSTPAPGSLRISPWPQMEGGRSGEGFYKVLRFTSGNLPKTWATSAQTRAKHQSKSVEINGNQAWQIASNDRFTAALL